jgi:hypothetical protein
MASDWRGYRAIVVNNQRFRWRCAFHYPSEVLSVGYARRGQSWPPDVLIVRPEDRPHRVLRVEWPACHGPLVTPALVRVCIEEGLRRGWLAEVPVLRLAGSELPVGSGGT